MRYILLLRLEPEVNVCQTKTLLLFFITDCTRSVFRDKWWTFGKLLDEGDKVKIKQGKQNGVDNLHISQTSR